MDNDDITEQSLESTDGAQAEPEEMLPKSRVNELIKKAKLKGRDAMTEELQQLQAENAQLKAQGSGMGGMPVQQQAPAQSIDIDALSRQITEKMRGELLNDAQAKEQAELQKEFERAAHTYHSKMAGGKELYEDFDKVMGDFDPGTFPNLVYLASNADNTAEIMYDLAQNPNKYVSIGVLSEKNPAAAAKELAKLSASIKANQQAKAGEKSVNRPLDRMQPSPTGQDSGGMEIADFKKKYRG